MAMKFLTPSGEAPKRHEYFHVNPDDIVVDQGARGRRFPPTPEQVKELAKSISENGQQQPIVCRKGPGGQLHCVSGFTRLEAATWLRADDPSFTIKVTVANINDKEAAVRNVVVNAHRNETSPIDVRVELEAARCRHAVILEELDELWRVHSSSKASTSQNEV